jgi:hypothetical protein
LNVSQLPSAALRNHSLSGITIMKIVQSLVGGLGFLLLAGNGAHALPAFAVQTGQPCAACHIGGFGPHLTPFGRQFKLSGYTLRAGAFTPPVSAIAIASAVHTEKDQPPPPRAHYDVNNNATLDYISAFLAGGFGNHFGSFAGVSYDGVERKFRWDHVDLRFADTGKLLGSDVAFGLDLNNEPSGQDVWATLPVWGFPFTNSDLAPHAATATVLSGAFAQGVIGASAYAWWNSSVYGEVALYRSLSRGMLRAVGQNPDDFSLIDGVAPYVRFAYQHDYGNRNFEVGAFGFFPNAFPGRDKSTGKTDGYADVGLDASYEYLGMEDIFTANARFTHEHRDLAASLLLGNASMAGNTLDEVVVNGSYYWKNLLGATIGYFHTWGSADALANADNRTFKPDTAGWNFQLDVTPFRNKQDYPTRLNLRIGLQYTLFTEFNGASKNFNGLGRSASDNNTLRLFLWQAL